MAMRAKALERVKVDFYICWCPGLLQEEPDTKCFYDMTLERTQIFSCYKCPDLSLAWKPLTIHPLH